MASVNTLDNTDQTCIQDFLDVLEKHRVECERLGKYEEAELAKSRLEQLRTHEDNRRREELRSLQLAERLGVEEAHMKELQEFNEIWDKKVADFEAHATSLQRTLGSRHKQEHVSFMEKMQKETQPRTPRWSRELLNMRKIQETLAKQKKYSEAAKTKQQADVMEKKEHDAWKSKREGKIAVMEEQFLHKQQLEMGGLLKRVQSGREEQKQARKTELERLLQRYQNVKTQLEMQQTIIRQKAEKFPISSASNQSRYSISRPPSRGGSLTDQSMRALVA
eukprot:GEMP01026689.1.p1 GENE.GEMP01026689.1~~GEMP01026689.1.p1  ORF type:complete len:278 (+),score=83.46 GEMP01026689.1:174-1007(+)